MSKSGENAKQQIVIAGLELLKGVGAEGLTMRQVAAKAGKSLSNVQHHFNNRQALLMGMATYYFNECDNLLEEFIHQQKTDDLPSQVVSFIEFNLSQVEQISDACLVYRELWALSMRNQDIDALLTSHYQMLADKSVQMWSQYGKSQAQLAVSILLPYIEGYALIHKSLPSSRREIAEALAKQVLTCLV